MGVLRPNRAAPRLAGRGDPSPRGCPLATRAGGSPRRGGGGVWGAASLVVYPGVVWQTVTFYLSTRSCRRVRHHLRACYFYAASDAQHHAHWGATWIFASTVATSHLCGDACQRRQRRGRVLQRRPQSNRLGSLQRQHVTDLCDPSRGTHLDWRLCLRGLQQPHLSHLPGGTR